MRDGFQFVAFLFLIITTSTAQGPRIPLGGPQGGLPQGVVFGSVIDGKTGEPLPRATVALRYMQDSTLATGILTEKDGSFSINGVRAGTYYARVSYVGYTIRFIDKVVVEQGSSRVDMGRIELSPDASRGEVTVTGERQFVTVEVDRTTYKAADILTAQGGSASDVLKNIPTIEVDIDGKVSLRGNQNVVILVNGRPAMLSGDQLATFLRSLPASMVDRVEVIPNPSAKYDPDGVSGIINIVMKTGKNGDRGVSGGVNASVGTNDNYSAGGNIGWGSGPWNIFANYGLNITTRDIEGNRFRENLFLDPRNVVIESDAGKNRNTGHVLNGTVDYQIDQENALSLVAFFTEGDNTSDNRGVYMDSVVGGAAPRHYDRPTASDGDNTNMDYRLSYKWTKEAARHELSVEGRFGVDNSRNEGSYIERDLTPAGEVADSQPSRQLTRNDDDRTNGSVQIDYTLPVGEAGRLETGYKGEMVDLDGTVFSRSFDYGVGEFLADTAINNQFGYDRRVHALYVTYAHQIGDVGLQAGLRAEQALTTFDAKTTSESFDNDYFSLFPSGFVTWKPIDELQLKTSYSRRVQRPNVWTLNPFPSFDDPLFRRQGNPYLRPEYTDSYELSATWFHQYGIMTVNPYFRRTTDGINRYERVDSNGVSTLTWENYDQSETSGADLTATLRVGGLNAFGNLSVYRYVTDGTNLEEEYSIDDMSWSTRFSASWELPEGFDVQATWFYRGPFKFPGGRIEPFTMTDLALQKRFLDNQLRVGLRAGDIFNTMQFGVTRQTERFVQDITRKWGSRQLTLTLSYTFGAQDSKRRDRAPQTGREFNPMDMQ